MLQSEAVGKCHFLRLCQPGASAGSVCICAVRLIDDGRSWLLEAAETGNVARLDRPPPSVFVDFRHLTDVYVGKQSPLFQQTAMRDLPADRCFSFKVQTPLHPHEYIDMVADSCSDRRQHLRRLRAGLEQSLGRAVQNESMLEVPAVPPALLVDASAKVST